MEGDKKTTEKMKRLDHIIIEVGTRLTEKLIKLERTSDKNHYRITVVDKDLESFADIDEEIRFDIIKFLKGK